MVARAEGLTWLHDLAPDTVFRVGDVPGRRPLVYENLSRLCAGDDAMFERVARGVYFKRRRPGSGVRWSRQLKKALCLSAEPGGGPAGWTALNLFGWTLQMPMRWEFSTVASTPPRTTELPHVRWNCAAPRYRRGMSWYEVGLIEATREIYISDDTTWHEALRSVKTHHVLAKCRSWAVTPMIRPEQFERAAELERPIELEVSTRRQMGHRFPQSLPPLDRRLVQLADASRVAGF